MRHDLAAASAAPRLPKRDAPRILLHEWRAIPHRHVEYVAYALPPALGKHVARGTRRRVLRAYVRGERR